MISHFLENKDDTHPSLPYTLQYSNDFLFPFLMLADVHEEGDGENIGRVMFVTDQTAQTIGVL